jgi:hypothetical protein
MSFVSTIRDYVEVLNNLSNSFAGEVPLSNFLIETFSYFVKTIQYSIIYFFSLQWIHDFTLLPLIVPQISSSIFKETFFLENPSKVFFSFIELTEINQNKFLLGFFNSIFLTLPVSVIHIISIRRLFIKGIPSGIISISGYIIGQWFFILCIIFGFRAILIPWLSFEPLSYLIGLILVFRVIYKMTGENLNELKTWPDFGEFPTRINKNSAKYFQQFLTTNKYYLEMFSTSFLLAWCEQSSIFQYLGNISLTGNSSSFETFSNYSPFTNMLNHSTYLLGILLGSIIFTSLWGYFFIQLRNMYIEYTFSESFFKQNLNTISFILAIGISLSSIPFYSLDYLITNPLGFISQDKFFKNTIFDQYNLKDSIQLFGYSTRYESLDMDVSSFDRGRYLIFPPADTAPFSFEDLNYRGEAEWTTRIEKIDTMGDSRTGSLTLSKIVKNKKTEQNRKPFQFNLEQIFPIKSYFSLNQSTIQDHISDITTRFNGWYQRSDDDLSQDIETSFSEILDTTFPSDFLNVNVPNSVDGDIEFKIKQKYYSNPIYKNLLSIDIDLFLNRQPNNFFINGVDEFDLYTKRWMLSTYFDSLKAYSILPYLTEFEDFFDGSKSFSNKIYNQQFKGTLKSLCRLFSLTIDEEAKNSNDDLNELLPVLKYDQPLYLFSNSYPFSSLHEELIEPKKELLRNQRPKNTFEDNAFQNSSSENEASFDHRIQNSIPNKFWDQPDQIAIEMPNRENSGPRITASDGDRQYDNQIAFINEKINLPLYAGWDEKLRKFIVTNKYLPRNLAGYKININQELANKSISDQIKLSFSRSEFNTQSHKIKNFGTNSIPNKILDRPDQPNILNKQDKKQKRKIIFTVWPLPINILEKTKSESSIPYITLYNLNKEEGGEFISTLPSNWETVQRKQSFGKTFENVFDYLAPLRGGFIWPGSTKPNLNLIQ